ncbi:ABC transporter permease [Allocoleopsis franciscana]|uniref:ABC-type dipeptide/oligopeptide/nickel transport system, permease component n=1 Tax=Allocoleopsis franciscana PCC 7113 TaxID=1173027 RepID=K9WLK6_9CYAN|nr:ABC transporter permease [Allocoleopsis franciscana]AFZ21053.1 ABC-type dipeptide/oligopeptide/nickel transport system, permease component [Allocoleopsis franciscana PCC 7113]
MGRYILKRLLNLIPVLLGITLLVFILLHLIPGDPAQILAGTRATPETVEAIREQLGLNKPLLLQYLLFLGNLLRFNLGNSIMSGASIIQEIAIRWPATFELSVAAMFIALMLGIPAGVLAAVRKNSPIDNLTMSGSLLGVSMPVFWLGLLLIYLFAVNLQWLPPGLRMSQEVASTFKPLTGFYVFDALLQFNWNALKDVLAHLVLPALTLSTIPLAIIARITRSAMLEVLSQDYIRTARAKGVLERWVIFKHALKNALLPVVTIIGLQFGTLLSGAILTETIFSWPGIGFWIYDGILNRDYPVVQGGVIFVSISFVLINLLVDISYAFLDPRIQYR